jgi:hypothetical protein
MKRIIYYLKQLLPLTYREWYMFNRERYFKVYRQWFGFRWNEDEVIVHRHVSFEKKCLDAVKEGEFISIRELIRRLRECQK